MCGDRDDQRTSRGSVRGANTHHKGLNVFGDDAPIFWVLRIGLNECEQLVVNVVISGFAESDNFLGAGNETIKSVVILRKNVVSYVV